MANNLLHQELSAKGNAIASVSIGVENMVTASLTIKDTLDTHLVAIRDALVGQKCQEFPTNPTCFFILFVVYDIGTWILGGRGKFELKACNEKLKLFCRSDEYKEIMELLKDQHSLKHQFIQVSKSLQRGTLEYRANRMTILTSFVLGIIIWCQTSQGIE